MRQTYHHQNLHPFPPWLVLATNASVSSPFQSFLHVFLRLHTLTVIINSTLLNILYEIILLKKNLYQFFYFTYKRDLNYHTPSRFLSKYIWLKYFWFYITHLYWQILFIRNSQPVQQSRDLHIQHHILGSNMMWHLLTWTSLSSLSSRILSAVSASNISVAWVAVSCSSAKSAVTSANF